MCFTSLVRSPSRLSLTTCVLHYKPALPLGRAFPSARSHYLSVSLLRINFGSTGISTRCPSSTPFGLDLGPDLPTYPGRTNLPQETSDFRRRSFSLRSRYLCRHSLFRAVHHLFRYGFCLHALLLYRYTFMYPQASVLRLSPVNLRRNITRPVSYYALF